MRVTDLGCIRLVWFPKDKPNFDAKTLLSGGFINERWHRPWAEINTNRTSLRFGVHGWRWRWCEKW